MEASCRLRYLLKTLTSCSSQLRRLRPFSSSAAASRRDSGLFSDDSEDSKESAVYKQVLKFQRPSTIKWKQELHNTAQFIGTVHKPPIIYNTRNGSYGVYTSLKVKPSRDSNRLFWIALHMWDEIAEVSFKYLKPNDFIYVSGRLGLYQPADDTEKLKIKYQVDWRGVDPSGGEMQSILTVDHKLIVKNINYVAQHGNVNTHLEATYKKRTLGAEQSGSTDIFESGLEKSRNRLHLWQIFFAEPFDWWDNRNCKLNPGAPDFKHKSTGEVLWLNPGKDPPWIRKELQRLDSRLAKGGLAEGSNYRSYVSPMVCNDEW